MLEVQFPVTCLGCPLLLQAVSNCSIKRADPLLELSQLNIGKIRSVGSEAYTGIWVLPCQLCLECLTWESSIKRLDCLKAWGMPGKSDPC